MCALQTMGHYSSYQAQTTSVLPSFKATFSSYAEADSAARHTDDNAISTPAPSTALPTYTASCQDRPRTSTATMWTEPRNHSSHTHTPRSPSHFTHPVPSLSNSSRPAVPLLPLEIMNSTDSPNDAPAFGFATRPPPKRTSLEPLPIDVLGFAVNDSPYLNNTSSLKRSSACSSQAPTQKRCRSEYHFADSSALKPFDRVSLPPVSMGRSHASSGLGHIQSATPSLTPSFHQPTTSNSSKIPISKMTRLESSTHASRATSNVYRRSSLSDGLLPPITEQRGKEGATASMAIAPSPNRIVKTKGLPPCNAAPPSTMTREGDALDKRKDGLMGQSTLSLSRATPGRDVSLSLFRSRSFSTNGAHSDDKQNDRKRGVGQTSSRVHAVQVVEDSTGRAPIDALSLRGDRSLPSASALSARTMQLAGFGPSGTGSTSAGGGIMALTHGPTASEFSHLMRSAARRRGTSAGATHTQSGLVDGTERLAQPVDTALQGDSGTAGCVPDDGRARASIGSLMNGDDGGDRAILHSGRGHGHSMVNVSGRKEAGSGETTTTTRVAGFFRKADVSHVLEDVQPVHLTSNSTKVEAKTEAQAELTQHTHSGTRIDSCSVEVLNCSVHTRRELKQEGGMLVTGDTDDEEKLNGEVGSGADGSTGGRDDEFVQCPNCPRRLRNQVTLQNHIRVVHDNNGNFRCGQCGLTFMWRSTLSNHVRLVHEKQRPYACDDCGKGFRWKSHLREHVWVVHKNEKPFQCETCGKTFGRKNNMQKHMRKHNSTNNVSAPEQSQQ